LKGKPKNVLVAHAPTVLMRPSEADRVAVEYERDPINADREFGASFLTSGAGAYFVQVDSCVDDAMKVPLAPQPELRAIAAADFAFNSDHSWLIIVRLEGGLAVVADWLEIKPTKGAPLKPSQVVDRFAEVMKRHGARTLIADGHYKESIREHIEAQRLRFQPADRGVNAKLAAYAAAQAVIREGSAVLPNLPQLLTPLRETTVRPTPGGGLSIAHPRRGNRGHGDAAAALVLALAAAAPILKRGGSRDRGGVGARNATALTGNSAFDIGINQSGRVAVVRSPLSVQSMFGNGRSSGGF